MKHDRSIKDVKRNGQCVVHSSENKYRLANTERLSFHTLNPILNFRITTMNMVEETVLR